MKHPTNKQNTYLTGFNLKPLFFFLLLIFTLQLFTFNSYGQSITWQRTYDGPYLYDQDNGQDICQTMDGNFICIGSSNVLGDTIRYTFVLKINSFGDTIWTKKFNNLVEGLSITNTPDNGCIIAGNKIARLDSNGKILWIINYPIPRITLNTIKLTSNNDYIGCGWSNENTSAYIIRIDSSGNIIWDSLYAANFSRFFNSLIEISNSNFIVVGTDYYNSIPSSLVTKITGSGDIIWEKYISLNNFGSIAVSINQIINKYIITGNTRDTITLKNTTYLINLDTNGNLIFSKYFNVTKNEYNLDCKVINSNRYVMTSYQDTSLQYFPNFALNRIVDSTGNIIYEKLFPTPRGSAFRRILTLTNRDIVFVGAAWLDASIDLYVVRTDSMLIAPPILGIVNEQNNIPKDYFLYQNFPNPFNPSTTIKFEINKKAKVELKIFDVLGNIVEIPVNKYLIEGKYDINIELKGKSTGIYFYQLIVDGKLVHSKKMILLK